MHSVDDSTCHAGVVLLQSACAHNKLFSQLEEHFTGFKDCHPLPLQGEGAMDCTSNGLHHGLHQHEQVINAYPVAEPGFWFGGREGGGGGGGGSVSTVVGCSHVTV